MKIIKGLVLLVAGASITLAASASDWQMDRSNPHRTIISDDKGRASIIFIEREGSSGPEISTVVIKSGRRQECAARYYPREPNSPVEVAPLMVSGVPVRAEALCGDGEVYFHIATGAGQDYLTGLAKQGRPIEVQLPDSDPLLFSNKDGAEFFKHIDEVYGGI